MIFIFCTIFAVLGAFEATCNPCLLREYEHGYVCVCNSTYCDDLVVEFPHVPSEYTIVSTSKGGSMFSVSNGKFLQSLNRCCSKPRNLIEFFQLVAVRKVSKVNVDRRIEHQKVSGFGGALTTAVSLNLNRLSENLKKFFYRSYFSEDLGIGYIFLRISIGGCDFDLRPWAYNEQPGNDVLLSNFTRLNQIDQDKVLQIKKIVEVSKNHNIKLMGAAWSPPPWMKSNKQWSGNSYLLQDYYQTWADYHIRFVELLSQHNISLHSMSTGNEPGNGNIGALFVRFMSLGWTGLTQGLWVGKYLGPTIRKSKFKHIKLFSPDDQRYMVPIWLQKMDEAYPGSTSFLDGIAFHWYWDDFFPPSLLDEAHKLYGNKLLFNTESCIGDKPWEESGPKLGSWDRAEKYIRSFIQDFQHWVNGWIDWNLLLNEEGGPNYANNFVDAPIIVNSTGGSEFYKQPMFYAIGHFSKFVSPNSFRISSNCEDANIESVAFRRPDNRIVVIALNRGSQPIDLTLMDNLRGTISVTIPAKSMHTIIYN